MFTGIADWWTRSQPIPNTAEIPAHIKILPVKHPHLYQKLAQKATELHLLGMSYTKIAKILNIDPKTAINAVIASEAKQSLTPSFPRKRESKRRYPPLMRLPFGIYNLLNPERYIWLRVRILHETDKAILVYNGMKTWIPKSQIHGIRLKKNAFEIYIREGI